MEKLFLIELVLLINYVGGIFIYLFFFEGNLKKKKNSSSVGSYFFALYGGAQKVAVYDKNSNLICSFDQANYRKELISFSPGKLIVFFFHEKLVLIFFSSSSSFLLFFSEIL